MNSDSTVNLTKTDSGFSPIPFQIREGDLAGALTVAEQIQEFENPYGKAEYRRRLKAVNHLILTAVMGAEPVAFKVGYDRFGDGSFYSWMGGVLNQYRRQGLAGMLANYQEQWARCQGYQYLRMKTLRRHNGMLQFALKRGFSIIRISPKKQEQHTIIWLEKSL